MINPKHGIIGFLIGFILTWVLFYMSGTPFERSPQLMVAGMMSLIMGFAGIFFGALIGDALEKDNE